MTTGDWGQVIGAIASIAVGLFAVLKYFANQNEKTVNAFLTYIEKKNGNMERLGQVYAESISKTNDVNKSVAQELSRFSTVMELTLKK